MSATTAPAVVASQGPLASPRDERRVSLPTLCALAIGIGLLALARLKRHGAGAAIVFKGERRPRAVDIVGVITKRAIADTVIASYED